MPKLRIAVVGAGISGLSAAWLLSQRHNVVLYEAEHKLGGHANTVTVTAPEGERAIDTGFIVYNVASYPNLIALFDLLGVATAPSSMSFSVSLDAGRYEYSGTGALGLFGQLSNCARPSHWRMSADILRFFRDARALADGNLADDIALGEWLQHHRYSAAFVDRHIAPMAAAIWSTPSADVLAYPARAFARFFANHGLLQVRNRPQWRTVHGGSREYINRLAAKFRGEVRLVAPVRAVIRDHSGGSVRIDTGDGLSSRFDHVVLACHANQALALIADPDNAETALLGAFRYATNDALLHTDRSVMPVRKRLWSSWNYIGNQGRRDLCVTYWMNRLQPLDTTFDYFMTLNGATRIAPERIVARFAYAHPQFDQGAMRAQAQLWDLQGRRRTWFCGSYFGAGFHEDGLQAGLAVAEDLGDVVRPWSVANASGRIARRRVPVEMSAVAE